MTHGLNNGVLYAAKKIRAVYSKNGTEDREARGTGFFIKKDEDIFLITNRHVIDPAYSDSSFCGYGIKQFLVESYAAYEDISNPQLLNVGKIMNHSDFVTDDNPQNDVACLKNPKVEGEDITVNAHIDYSLVADREWIDEKLSVCDTIAYPGFPEWFDRKNNTPIFRMGTIASDPRLDYSCNPNEERAERIAYEGFSSGGASGSPVFAVQKGFRTGAGLDAPTDFYREVKLVGVNAGHFSSKEEGHSGISFFYKSSTIVNLIHKLQENG